MKIDGPSFDQQWSWGKTEAEFVKEFIGMEHIYPDADDKAAKLKEVYAQLQHGKPADFKMPKPVVVASTPGSAAPAGKPSGATAAGTGPAGQA